MIRITEEHAMRHLLQFEAFFIQPYLFQSGKLKEMIGASHLLETLVARIEDHFLTPLLGADHDIRFLRKAGSAFIAETEDRDTYTLIHALWPLYVRARTPGLQFGWAGISYGAGTDTPTLSAALKHLRTVLDTQKNIPAPRLPGIAPITQRYQRTGDAALPKTDAQAAYSPGSHRPEPISAAANAQRLAASDARHAFSHLLPQDGDYRFPRCFNTPGEEACKPDQAFPFKSGVNPEEGGHDIALIHADGNSVGQYIISLFKALDQMDEAHYRKTYSAFSNALTRATQQAVRRAIETLIPHTAEGGKTLPIRPLVVGGDDITCIVRADLALPFVTTLLQAFEQASCLQLDGALTDASLRGLFPEHLTMTAGIAYFKSNQPFTLGYGLSESLTERAKEAGRNTDTSPPPSMIAFHQVTQSLFEQADTQLEEDNRTPTGKLLGQTVWSLHPHEQLHGIDHLLTLYRAFKSIGDDTNGRSATFSFLRKLAGTLHTDPAHAERMWHRWLKNNPSATRKLRELEVNENWLHQDSLPLADLLALHRTETRIDTIN